LGGNPKSFEFWAPMVEKVKKRLEGWKNVFLSKGGRLVLIHAVLHNIPTYYLSLFRIPVGVAKRFEKIIRNFLWEDITKEKRLI